MNIVLHRLFPDANRIVLAPLPEEIGSLPAASRRHSVVLKAYINDLEPMAVKLAPARQIQVEHTNYQKVNGRLVGQFLAKLENTAEFWDLGGACYTFLGSSFRSLPSFQDYYCAEEKPERVLKPLIHFFGEVWGRLYGKPQSCRGCITLFQRYDRAFHIGKHLRKLDAGEGVLSLPGLLDPLINPLLWILEHHDESLIDDARLAITHGDLHAQICLSMASMPGRLTSNEPALDIAFVIS